MSNSEVKTKYGRALSLILALCMIMIFRCSPANAAVSDIQGDLALNKTATASSIEGSGYEAAKAFDGNTTTRWASLEGTDPQWIYVDLGLNANISGVKLLWEDAYAKSYQIQISADKSQWTDVYSTTSGNGGEDLISFEQKNARYVRMYGSQRGTSYGYSLFSFEVYGTGGPEPQVPAVPAGLSATAASSSKIDVSWSASLGATGYDLEADGIVVSNVTSPYAHTGLAAGSLHNYRVRAKNTNGTSSWSSPVSATTESGGTGGINMPFPQQVNFTGCIKPNNVTQAQMNNTIKSYYDYWKSAYIRESNGTTPGGGYYVEMKGTGGTGNEITTSEAHGYGMLIFTIMAGYDSQAKMYFDGMYNMYDKHRSKIDSDLMSWLIDKSELTSKDSDSATDGDMDIAYALLMAHKQWGSNGSINYLSEARRIITNGIRTSDMSLSSKRTMLGDWDTDPLSTRSSDWMTGHFHTYYNATNDSFWNDAANTAYGLITRITGNYASNTGLMPDFIVGDPAKPAPPNFLEADTDDDYSWNACRYPWRIAMDYAHYGTTDSKNACNKMVNWIKTKTGNNPSNIRAGYKLNGDQLTSDTSAAFTAPFIAACVVDSGHQDYLNAGWSKISNLKEGYYGDSINLLCMLFISGNWWKPTGF